MENHPGFFMGKPTDPTDHPVVKPTVFSHPQNSWLVVQ
jgi:hypothetical protein